MRRPARHLSLGARVAVFAGVAVALAVTVTTLGIYLTVRAQLYGQLEDDLLARAKVASTALHDPDVVALLPADALGDAQIGLVTADREVYPARGSQLPMPGAAEFAVASGHSPQSVRVVEIAGTDYVVAAVPAGAGSALVMAVSTTSVDERMSTIGAVSLVVGLLGVVVAATVGYVVARAGLRPLRALTDATERVASSMDLTPIEVQGTDEIGRLASSFNAMLASLADARERERQLIADAGHELRTPLTSLRTNLDLLSQSGFSGRALDPGDQTELLTDVQGQLVELGRLVDDLVQLSREDGTPGSHQPVDLAAVVDDALVRVRRRTQDVTFQVATSSWWVEGDRAALERAVTNLLDNAVKWSPPGGVVTVQVHEGVLSVADEGPGIDPDDRPHVFDRFYRAEGARSLPGSGLGLAIVAQAVTRHGGRVSVGEGPAGGARFDLLLPGHPDP